MGKWSRGIDVEPGATTSARREELAKRAVGETNLKDAPATQRVIRNVEIEIRINPYIGSIKSAQALFRDLCNVQGARQRGPAKLVLEVAVLPIYLLLQAIWHVLHLP